MQASLIESDDEHHWILLDHQVTQLLVDATSLRLQTWSLDASLEIRVSAPFTLHTAAGAVRALDPADAEQLAPVLSLLRRRVRSLTATRRGELALEFGDGARVDVAPHARLPAWEVQGGGTLEGLAYRSEAGGGAPWE
jgi:hypothetical protein